MRRKVGIIVTILGTVLLLAALSLFIYNSWDNWRAGQNVAEVQDVLRAAEDQLGPVETVQASNDKEQHSDEMSAIEFDGHVYIGTLSIPRFGLELPIMGEWSYPGLKIAPGRYSGSVWTDNMILCGHNYERHFGNLKNLNAGDRIEFLDVDENLFTYEVKEIEILQPTDVEEMLARENGDWDLTLFTCTLGGQTRVTVRCSRVD